MVDALYLPSAAAAAAAPAAAAAAVDVATAATTTAAAVSGGAPGGGGGGYPASAPISDDKKGHGGSRASSTSGDWTTTASSLCTPPQTPPLDWGGRAGGDGTDASGSGSSTGGHDTTAAAADQQFREPPAAIMLALPYLFVPFLTTKDCLALAATGKALFPFHCHVRVLTLRPPTVAPALQHYSLRRLVKRLQPGIRTLQLRPNKASQMEGPMVRVVADLIASGLLTTLMTLDAAHVSLRPVGARTLAAALAGGGCAGLLHLNLAHTDIGDTGATEIAKALHNGLGAALAPLLPTTPPHHQHPYFTFPPFPPAAAHTAPAAAAATAAATAAAAVPPLPPRPLSPSPLGGSSTTTPPTAAAAGLYTGGSLYPPFPACPRLQSLSLAGTGVTDAGLIALADLLPSGCPNLQSLDLSCTSASAVGWTRGVEVLMGPQGLTDLRSIRLPRAGSAGGQALRSVARALASGGGLCLHELDFSGLCITDGGVLALAQAFRRRRAILAAHPGLRHAPLRRLVLMGGCVGPSGLGALLGEIGPGVEGGLAALAHLDLSGAQLNGGPVTLGILLHFLRHGAGPGLRSLGLARCGLGNHGVEGVAAALAEGRCACLEELRLGANGCRASGAARLVEALVVRRAACPALRLLSLDLNLLGAEGVKDVLLRLAHGPWEEDEGDEEDVVGEGQRERRPRPPPVRLSLRGMGFSPASMMVPAAEGLGAGAMPGPFAQEPPHAPAMTAAEAFAAYRRLLSAIPAECVWVDVRAG